MKKIVELNKLEIGIVSGGSFIDGYTIFEGIGQICGGLVAAAYLVEKHGGDVGSTSAVIFSALYLGGKCGLFFGYLFKSSSR